MTKTYFSMTAAMPDFSPMIDLWTRQAELALYMNRQWTRIALAPWHAVGAAATASPVRKSAPRATPPVAAPAPKAVADVPVPQVAAPQTPAPAPATAEAAVAETPHAAAAAPVETAPAQHPQAKSAESQAHAAVQPAGIAAPRGGTSDALTGIKGLGPKLEEALNAMGIYHFDQIARWTAAEIAWIDENVGGIRGRASREDWKGQAATLARSDAG